MGFLFFDFCGGLCAALRDAAAPSQVDPPLYFWLGRDADTSKGTS